MEFWKVICLVGKNNQLIGYDMLSSTGRKMTVTPQQLSNAINNGVVVNAVIEDNQIKVTEQVDKRIYEEIVNIQLTMAEFKAIYPDIGKLYDKYNRHPDKNKTILTAISKFVNLKNEITADEIKTG